VQRQIAIGIGIVVVIALAAWWWLAASPAPPSPVEKAPVPPPVQEEAAAPEEVVAPALPPLDGSDTLLRDELFALGLPGPLAGLLDTREIVRSVVVAVNAVAGGRSPRDQVGFLAPDGYFDVIERGAGLYVDPESYRRYDALAAAVAAVDAEAAVRSYLRLEPLADLAYAELGMQGSFRDRLAEAIEHLLGAPVLRGEIEVEDAIDRYRFAEPELEGLSDAQKHLLRTGPDNEELIQQQLRRFRDALFAAN